MDPQIDVTSYLQKLTPAYRTVFNLYVMEEYKHQEIAEILGISVNTSKSNLSRAKDQLRNMLSQNIPANKHKKSNGV
ncbi:MAG: sigma-70 family RNA polymerase sigma factor [Saprospiraceae bacterium]